MALNFGTYSYIGPIAQGKTRADYEFNDEKKKKIQQMLNEKRYIDAANELSNYTFADTKEDERFWGYIQNLKDQGSIAEAVYSRIQNEDDKQKLMFSSNVYTSGGLDNFNQMDNNGQVRNRNKYAEIFGAAKQALGSYMLPGVLDPNTLSESKKQELKSKAATRLEFTFQQAQNKLLGFDALSKDNNMTIDNFYKVSGLSQLDLDRAGVIVKRNEDGSSSISFDKSNPLANQLMVGLSRLRDFDKSFFGKISDLLLPGGTQSVEIKGYDREGNLVRTTDHRDNAIRIMSGLVDETKNAADAIFSPQNVGDLVHNSIAAPYVPSEDEEKLIDSELNLAYSIDRYPEIYSDYYDDNSGKLRPLSQEEREQIIREITGTDPKRRKYSYVVEGGNVGLAIELAPIGTPDDERKNSDDDDVDNNTATQGRQRRIFIPGMLAEQAQRAIDNDPIVKAKQIANNLQSFGAVYHTVDDKSIKLYPNGEGALISKIRDTNGNIVEHTDWLTPDEVTNEIAKSKTVELATRQLLSQYTNIDGNLIDSSELETQMKGVAISQMNELYGLSFADENGNIVDPRNQEQYIKTVFDILSSPTRLAKYRASRSALEYKRLMDIFEVYKNLQLNIRKYR